MARVKDDKREWWDPPKGHWVGRWEGGRISRGRDGSEVYWIEQRVDGKVRQHRLKGLGYPEARKELAAFGLARSTYVAPHIRDALAEEQAAEEARLREAALAQEEANAVVVDPQMLEDFAAALRTGEHDGRGPRSEKHVRDTVSYVRQWGESFLNRDLRTLAKREMDVALDEWGSARQKRIAAFKTLTAWLKRTGRLRATEDPSTALVCPQYVAPSEADKAERVYDPGDLAKVYKLIDNQMVRDVMRCRLFTGAHLNELSRFAIGEGALLPVENGGEIHSVLVVKHKKGAEHRISVNAETAAALVRLKARGKTLPWTTCSEALDAACEQAGVERMLIANMRHTFATLARRGGRIVHPPQVNGGVPLEAVSLALGHTSTKITRTFYVSDEVPAMIVPPLRLQHRDDPPVGGGKRKPSKKTAA